jgi:hypothetical protein
MGAASSAMGKIQAGNAGKDMMNFNAGIADWQAQDALARGRINEKRSRQQTEQTIGTQRVALASQGVDVNRGSALDVQADAAYLGELDAITIRNNAQKEAWGYKTQAANYRYQGSNAQREGMFGAFQTIVGAGGSLLLAKYGAGIGTTAGRSSSVPLDFNPATAGR